MAGRITWETAGCAAGDSQMRIEMAKLLTEKSNAATKATAVPSGRSGS